MDQSFVGMGQGLWEGQALEVLEASCWGHRGLVGPSILVVLGGQGLEDHEDHVEVVQVAHAEVHQILVGHEGGLGAWMSLGVWGVQASLGVWGVLVVQCAGVVLVAS